VSAASDVAIEVNPPRRRADDRRRFGQIGGSLADRYSGAHLDQRESSALLSVILVDVWEWTPFLFLLLSAGLQAILRSRSRRAHRWARDPGGFFCDVTLPLLKPTILASPCCLRAMDLVPDLRSDFHPDAGRVPARLLKR